jgi:hypothetical protein
LLSVAGGDPSARLLGLLDGEFRGGVRSQTGVRNREPASDGAAEGSRSEALFGPLDGRQTLAERSGDGVVGLLAGEWFRRVKHCSGLVRRRSVIPPRFDRLPEKLLHPGPLIPEQLPGLIVIHRHLPNVQMAANGSGGRKLSLEGARAEAYVAARERRTWATEGELTSSMHG